MAVSYDTAKYPDYQVDPFGLGSIFEGAPSGIDLGSVPQPVMPEMVNQMINGMGYDPATLAAMRAGAIDDTAMSAMPQMAATRRALGSAGLTNSPAGQAYLANIGRQTGDRQNQGLQQVGILDAQMKQQNRLSGLGLAHQWAMENANRLFDAMGQNLQQSGANTRAAVGTAFGTNPMNPGSGNPQKSRFGDAIGGFADAIGQFGQQEPQAQQADSPMSYPGTPPFVEPTLQMNAFQQNPYKGFS